MCANRILLLQSILRRCWLIFRQKFAFLLTCTLVLVPVPLYTAAPDISKPETIKANVEKLVVGEHVMVRLTEGTKVHRRIAAIQPLGFRLRPDKSQSEIQIPYSQVSRIKKNPGGANLDAGWRGPGHHRYRRLQIRARGYILEKTLLWESREGFQMASWLMGGAVGL
jgi:hypothetical protein